MPSARSTRQVGWPRPCKGFSTTASLRRRRRAEGSAARLTCMRHYRRRRVRGCGGLQRPSFSCRAARRYAPDASSPHALPPAILRACMTAYFDKRLPGRRALIETRTCSGQRLLLALSICSFRYSISALTGCDRTACLIASTEIFARCMRALMTVRAALAAALCASAPPSLWRPFVLKILCLTLLHLSIFALLCSCALVLLNMRTRNNRNAITRTTGASK